MAFKAGAIYGQAILNTKQWTAGLTLMQKSTVLGMAAITAVFTTAMIKTGTSMNEWSKELANVSTLIDTDAISMDKLNRQLLHLNPELGNTTELTRGLYEAFSAGSRTAEEAMELTTVAARFGKAALTDTFTAVDVLSTAINAYGKETMTAEHASDVFFTTIKFGKVVGEELANAIGTSIPLYASVGISLEELTAGMAAMTKQGVHARRSTTQLNAIVNSFLKPSETMIKQLQGLGYESGAAFLKAEGLSGALKMLEEATGADATAFATLLPNIRAMRGVMALSGVGAEEFNFILGEMNDVVGVSQQAFEKQDKVWATSAHALHKVGLEVGVVSKQFIDQLLIGVTKTATSFIELGEVSKNFISTFIVVGATIGTTTLAVIGLKTALTALVTHPITAAIIGTGLLVTGLVTLIKVLSDKRLLEVEERFEPIAEIMGIAAEQTDEFAKSMLALEQYLGAESGDYMGLRDMNIQYTNMEKRIESIADKWGLTQLEIIKATLHTSNITDAQRMILIELQKELTAREVIQDEIDAQHEMSVKMSALLDQRSIDLETEKYLQQEVTNALQATQQAIIDLEIEREKAELAELARVAGVVTAKLNAEESYRASLSKTEARFSYDMITTREYLEQTITATATLAEAMIDIGYDASTAGDKGNEVLELMLTLLEAQRIKLDDILEKEKEVATEKAANAEAEKTARATALLDAELLISQKARDLTLIELLYRAHSKIITDIEQDELDRRKQLYKDWFSFISTGTQALVSSLSTINSLATQNELDDLTLKYQTTLGLLKGSLDDELSLHTDNYANKLALLEEDFNNGLITQAEYDEQKVILEQETSDNKLIAQEEYDAALAILNQDKAKAENKLKKDAFETNKKFDIANVWMSAADAIMGYWASTSKLGVPAGPIAAAIMTALTLGFATKQTSLIKKQQFVPSMAGGGRASGVTRVNEDGGEIFNLPDGTIVIPNDISRQIANDSGEQQTIINVNFAGANIANDMDLNKIVDQVSRKLGQQLRTA